jgi:RNA polymerase sigma factor (sigma-70 family)
VDDLASDVWRRLARWLPGNDLTVRFSTFAAGLARNRARSYLRDGKALRRDAETLPLDAPANDKVNEVFGDFIADDRPGPEELALARIEVQELERWLSTLAPPTRRTIEMHAEGWSCKEIGQALGISRNSVKQRRHRALSQVPGRVPSNLWNRVIHA